MTALRISDAAAATSSPASTLRYWERTGLFTATRTAAGYRTYDERSIERLRFISAAKRLDLSLADVGDLVRSWDLGTCAGSMPPPRLPSRGPDPGMA